MSYGNFTDQILASQTVAQFTLITDTNWGRGNIDRPPLCQRLAEDNLILPPKFETATV